MHVFPYLHSTASSPQTFGFRNDVWSAYFVVSFYSRTPPRPKRLKMKIKRLIMSIGGGVKVSRLRVFRFNFDEASELT